MARSSDSDDYHRSSRRRRRRSSTSSSDRSSSSSSEDSRERRRRRRSRSRSTPKRRRSSRDRSRERSRRKSRSRSPRRSGSRSRRERSRKQDNSSSRRRRTRSRRRRSRSSSASGDSRRRDAKKHDERREHTDTNSRGRSASKECSRDAFVVELPLVSPQNEAERQKTIENINSAGFSQQNFVSKRGQQPSKSEENLSAGGNDAHVSAMFGTTSLEEFLAGQAKKPPKLTDYKNTPELLIHENLYDEPERRQERWRKKLQTERRKRLVAQIVPATASSMLSSSPAV